MEDIDVLLEFDSRYGYNENNQHIHAGRYSAAMISPMANAFEMPMVSSDFHPAATAIYPSPTSSERGTTASPRPTTPDHLRQHHWTPAEDGSVRSPSPADGEFAEGSTTGAKPPAKRKRENRYKNAPPSVLSRRRAQNRASQRAYRERKDQRIKDLEVMLAEQKQKNDSLGQAYSVLHAEYTRLRSGPAMPPPPPPQQQQQQQQQQPARSAPVPGQGVMQAQAGGMPMYDVGGLGYGATDAMFMYQNMAGDYGS